MPSILDKIDWLVTVAKHHPVWKSVRAIISLSATFTQMSRGILLSSIASIGLFLIFSRIIDEYAHIWLRLIIEIVTLTENFFQTPRK